MRNSNIAGSGALFPSFLSAAGQPVKDCSNDQTYCIYCGNKRATCIPDGGQQCKAYYHVSLMVYTCVLRRSCRHLILAAAQL